MQWSCRYVMVVTFPQSLFPALLFEGVYTDRHRNAKDLKPKKKEKAMSEEKNSAGGSQCWANFRFSVVGSLLAAPPEKGALRTELTRLAGTRWRHPITGQWTSFGASTIERWYYRALREKTDPVGVLRRKVREDCGSHPSVSASLRDAISVQYRQHPNWSYQLHYENLVVLSEQEPLLRPIPGYGAVHRYMKAHSMFKRKRLGGRRQTAGSIAAEQRFEEREIRSYESEYVNALWHLDFHHGSVRVLAPSGQWVYPLLLGTLDDHSRVCPHLQWYFRETADELIHGLSQAFLKCGLPRALMTDNGSAMTAAETVEGLQRLGILHETTLPYSPYQNGKQESFWGQIEGRLLSMLDGVNDLTLARLNEATQAWVEMEYNRKLHSEINDTPMNRFVKVKDVGRPAPDMATLRQLFTKQCSRKQRRSDGTISVENIRFEIPSRYRQLERMSIRYAGWDLSYVYLCNDRSGEIITRLYPLDKQKNADSRRRRKEPIKGNPTPTTPVEPTTEMAPLLKKLIAQYHATGLPPAYLPKDEINPTQGTQDHE
jgi:putative transposase